MVVVDLITRAVSGERGCQDGGRAHRLQAARVRVGKGVEWGGMGGG